MSIGLGLNTNSSSHLSVSRITQANTDSLRSASSMQGLFQAENGDGMVELDSGNGTSGFKTGSRIIPESLHLESADSIGSEWSPEKASQLSRHGTLLTANATPSRKAAELKSILGNANARLKPGASILPAGAMSSMESTSLEQAKPRARVEVDVIPETNIFVQGGYINGTVKIRIRPRTKTESGALISDGKIRVVGFECIQNEEKRHTFYQQSLPLSEASPFAQYLFNSPPDNEGFYRAKEGVHVLPFCMYLMLGGGEGTPKGTIAPHAGVAVRYIIMISVKVKEIETDRRSIAHFYRDCEVWPRLNPSAILAPAEQPIRESAAKSLFMGGSGKVGLTASLHRITWVAGAQCCVKIRVINKSKKTIKSLTTTLFRSTVTYKPNPSLEVGVDESGEHDADACQTSTSQKQVAESVLEMGQRDHARGHASAKGWWAGVRPDETAEFCHFLSLPSDAISIPRARLLEISYNLRVTVSAGPLRSELHVILPIRIINFLSVDPPPSFPREDPVLLDFLGRKPPPEIDEIPEENAYVPHTLNGRMLEPLSEDDPADAEYDSNSDPETDNESTSGRGFSSQSSLSKNLVSDDHDSQLRQLGNATAHDDNEEFVQQAVTSLRVDAKYGECGGRFADLYYSSVQSEADKNVSADIPTPHPSEKSLTSHSSTSSVFDVTQHKPGHPRNPSSFADRVQKKLQAKEDSKTFQTTAIESSLLPPLQSSESSVNHSKLSSKRASTRTGMARKRSSTVGSYFRPREEIPDEVEVVDEEKRPPDDVLRRSPSESSRKASKLSSSGSKAGSRTLPVPPSSSTSGLPPQSGVSALMNEILSTQAGSTTSDNVEVATAVASSAQRIVTPEEPKRTTVRTRSYTVAATTTFGRQETPRSIECPLVKSSVGGNSVKDRIRMLEEKARGEIGLENSGLL